MDEVPAGVKQPPRNLHGQAAREASARRPGRYRESRYLLDHRKGARRKRLTYRRMVAGIPPAKPRRAGLALSWSLQP